jgi:hypothetical protein
MEALRQFWPSVSRFVYNLNTDLTKPRYAISTAFAPTTSRYPRISCNPPSHGVSLPLYDIPDISGLPVRRAGVASFLQVPISRRRTRVYAHPSEESATGFYVRFTGQLADPHRSSAISAVFYCGQVRASGCSHAYNVVARFCA